MKTIALAVLTTALFLFGAVILDTRSEQELMSSTFSTLRQLRFAIEQYCFDARNAGRDPIYPQSLEDVAKENYIPQEILKLMITCPAIIYISPKGKASSSDIILKAHLRDKIISCTLGGDLRLARTK